MIYLLPTIIFKRRTFASNKNKTVIEYGNRKFRTNSS